MIQYLEDIFEILASNSMYSEKASKIVEMSRFFLTLLLFSNFKHNWEVFSNFVAFSEYINFIKENIFNCWMFWYFMSPENSKFQPILYYLTRFFMRFLRIFQASFSHLSCKDYRYRRILV